MHTHTTDKRIINRYRVGKVSTNFFQMVGASYNFKWEPEEMYTFIMGNGEKIEEKEKQDDGNFFPEKKMNCKFKLLIISVCIDIFLYIAKFFLYIRNRVFLLMFQFLTCERRSRRRNTVLFRYFEQ